MFSKIITIEATCLHILIFRCIHKSTSSLTSLAINVNPRKCRIVQSLIIIIARSLMTKIVQSMSIVIVQHYLTIFLTISGNYIIILASLLNYLFCAPLLSQVFLSLFQLYFFFLSLSQVSIFLSLLDSMCLFHFLYLFQAFFSLFLNCHECFFWLFSLLHVSHFGAPIEDL